MFHILLLVLASICHPSLADIISQCISEKEPKTRTFASLEEYQRTKISFNPHHPGYQGNAVNFSLNKLETIPKNSFFSFGSDGIVDINLARKHIRQIDPGAFLGLDCLMTLNLNYNELTELSEGVFQGLEKLKFLLVSDNFLEAIPDGGMAFLHLINLEVLDLSGNRIKTLPSITFDSLRNLESLNLSYNQIEIIDDTVFNTLSNLKYLLLNNNNLATITPDRWKNLNQLATLNLGNNYLTSFDTKCNFSFNNLLTLNLTGNSIRTLNGKGLKQYLKQLRVLDVTNNSWLCENLNELKTALATSKIELAGQIFCAKAKVFQLNLAEILLTAVSVISVMLFLMFLCVKLQMFSMVSNVFRFTKSKHLNRYNNTPITLNHIN